MARNLPAKPLAHDEVVLALEGVLDDSFVIFQRAKLPGVLMIAQPDLGLCALACVPGPRTFDGDADAWDGADLLDVKISMMRELGDLAVSPVAAVAYLPDTPAPAPGAPGRNPLIAFAGQVGHLPGIVKTALQTSAPLPETAITALIRELSPGASDYVRGTVPDAQRRWRDDGRPTASGAVMPSIPDEGAIPDVLASPSSAATSAPKRADMPADHPLLHLIREVVETAAQSVPIFARGVKMSASAVADPDCLLPALLISAAQDWAPVVVSKKGKGGFHIRMRTDPRALVGYRVVDIEPSAPLLLLLPIIHRLRGARKATDDGGEEILLDDTVEIFIRWLNQNMLSTDGIDELEVRIALQT